MSDMTPCCYCSLQRMRYDAKRCGSKIVTRPANSGVEVFEDRPDEPDPVQPDEPWYSE